MNPTLHQQIHDELVILLNREPTEDEITNGQTDTYIMQQIILNQLEA